MMEQVVAEPQPTQTDTGSIEEAVTRAGPGLQKYCWIQNRCHTCGVTLDMEFQRRFKGFYRVRRDQDWCDLYFGLLEEAKTKSTSFMEALTHIADKTGRVEASYVSKLVATIDPSMPVIDRFVLQYFDLRLPAASAANRLTKVNELYMQLNALYEKFIASQEGREMARCFDACYQENGLTPLKKIDLVLWQLR